MKSLIIYLRSSYGEIVQRVTWPTYKEAQNHAFIVLIATLIFALLVAAIDMTIENLMKMLYDSF